jgi:hypothetical protein
LREEGLQTSKRQITDQVKDDYGNILKNQCLVFNKGAAQLPGTIAG